MDILYKYVSQSMYMIDIDERNMIFWIYNMEQESTLREWGDTDGNEQNISQEIPVLGRKHMRAFDTFCTSTLLFTT